MEANLESLGLSTLLERFVEEKIEPEIGSDTNITIFFRIFRTFGNIKKNWRYFEKNGSFEIFRAFFSYLDRISNICLRKLLHLHFCHFF